MALAVLLQGTPGDVASSAPSYYGTFWFSLALLGPIATLILVLQYKKP